MSAPRDPVGEVARTEMNRLAHRWHTLPVGQARSSAPDLRSLASAWLGGEVPDLGPACALDQLRVALHEVSLAGLADDEAGAALVALRQSIAANPPLTTRSSSAS